MSNLYPSTQSFVSMNKVLYPVTNSFVVKLEDDVDFSITINSGTDASFTLPTCGRLNNTNNSYAWIITWGDGTTNEHSGMGDETSGITHTYPNQNTEYKITIKPQNISELGWLRAFGFYNYYLQEGSNLATNKAKVISVNGQLTEQMICIKPTNSNICGYMFHGCINLTMGDSFQLPQDLTSVGEYFCVCMFENCTSLTMNANFQLPQGLTSVGEYFCAFMFERCTSLTMNANFQLPQDLTTTVSYFCAHMFYECTSLTMNANFQLPQDLTSVGVYCFWFMFYGCTSLTMNANFQLPQGLTSVGEYFCAFMFYECTSLTMNANFQLPQDLTTTASYFCVGMFYRCRKLKMNDVFQLPQGLLNSCSDFCASMFEDCISLSTGVIHFFGNICFTGVNLNYSHVYYRTFYGCSSISETLVEISQMQQLPNSRLYTFVNCPADIIATLHANWK